MRSVRSWALKRPAILVILVGVVDAEQILSPESCVMAAQPQTWPSLKPPEKKHFFDKSCYEAVLANL